MDPLETGGYPALYQTADALSLQGQQHFLLAFRTRLAGLVIAAVGGGLLVSVECASIGAWLALGGFLTALLADSYLAISRPEGIWYEGRAAAESVKTLAWRYAVRGESFEGPASADVDAAFVDAVLQVLTDLPTFALDDSRGSQQITLPMRELRDASFSDRRSAYRDGRIESQRTWYEAKARRNKTATSRWRLAVLAGEGAGVFGGVMMVANGLAIDLVGLFAVLVAVVTAWTEAKQHATLSSAYAVTAQELAGVRSELDAVTGESGWAEFVGKAEEAISREHTLWRASRGVRVTKRRGRG